MPAEKSCNSHLEQLLKKRFLLAVPQYISCLWLHTRLQSPLACKSKTYIEAKAKSLKGCTARIGSGSSAISGEYLRNQRKQQA